MLLNKVKKIASFMLVLSMTISNLIFVPATQAVGASLIIGSDTANNGESISIPIFAASPFVDVASVTMYINYDLSLLEYIGYALDQLPSATVNKVGNQIRIVWFDSTGTTPISFNNADTLLNLNFNVISSDITTTNITFDSSSVIGDSSASVIFTTFTNGVITLNSDQTAPIVTEVTAVPTPTKDNTPSYTFNSTEAGTITYDGGCIGDATNANAGDNPIIFDTLSDGVYNSCTITVTDADDNASTPLLVNTFTVDTVAPAIISYTLNGVESNATFNPDLGETVEIVLNANENVYNWVSLKIENMNNSGIYKYYSPDCDGNSQCVKTWDGSISPGTLVDGVYKIKVKMKDEAGNVFDEYLAPYVIIVNTVTEDTTPPVITLLGNNPVNLNVDDIYADAGATASDDVDGDITASIVIVNPVNTNIADTYTVTYNVSDTAGNSATEVTRTVNVGEVPDIIPPTATIFYSATAPTNADVVATMTPSEPVTVTNNSGSLSYTFTANGTFTFEFSDAAGNTGSAVATVNNIDKVAPTITTKLGDGVVDYTIEANTTANLVFSEELSSSSETAVQNALSAGADRTLTYAWSGATLTITATEATTFANDVVVNVSDLAGNAAELLLVDSALSGDQTTPDTGTGDATLNNTTPQVVITNPTQEVNITIGSGTTNPTIDVSSFISGGTGTIPKITIESENADVAIPASTTVTSEDALWNGIINAPTVTTVELPETSGETTTLNTAIEIGFTGAKLSFDNAVRILIPDQAGKKAGYVRTGMTFTEITSSCSADSQATGDALAPDGDCKIDVGSDLVIWTKHFTKFAAYTQTAIPSTGGGGGIISTTSPTGASIIINNGESNIASANVTLTLSASNAIQMAISNNSDFTDVSWETYAASKEWVLTSSTGEKTVYAKFRSSNGGVSSVVSDSIVLNNANKNSNSNSTGKVKGVEDITVEDTTITDGDIIQCKSCSQPFAVYIVKITGNAKYIRHIASINIFNHYSHLKWENLKQVSSLNDYSLSGWVRVNTGTNGTAAPTDKVYEINGDQTRHWINMTAEQFLSHGGSEPAIFNINHGESNLYAAGADVTSL